MKFDDKGIEISLQKFFKLIFYFFFSLEFIKKVIGRERERVYDKRAKLYKHVKLIYI